MMTVSRVLSGIGAFVRYEMFGDLRTAHGERGR